MNQLWRTDYKKLWERRQFFGSLVGRFTTTSTCKSSKDPPSSKHGIDYEQRWLDTLKETDAFCHEKGRLPKRGEEGRAGWMAQWMTNQRTAKRCFDEGRPYRIRMTAERILILNLMPWWVWDPKEAAWRSKFVELEEFVEKYDEIPPYSHPTLGTWVRTQRIAYQAWQARLNGEKDKYKNVKSNMDQERAEKLESLKPWSWESLEDAWEAKYQLLVEYVHENKKIPTESHPT